MQISLLGKLLDLLFPRHCLMCGRHLHGAEEMLCTSCLSTLPRTDTWENPHGNEMVKIFWAHIPIERCASLFYYQGHSPASQSVYALKYGDRPDAGFFLGEMIGKEGIERNFFEGIDAIIPIPLTPERKEKRGYNQSEQIALGIRRQTQLPIITDAVRREVFTESQTHKNKRQRQENVEHAFQLATYYHDEKGRKHPITDLTGKHLLIVDDVCTTGATVNACCQELMKAGKMKFSFTSVGWTKE